jgi:rsbT co-antagonist protein RsbR
VTLDGFSAEFGLTEEALRRRLEIIGLSSEDRERIRSLEDLVHEHAERLTDSFLEWMSYQRVGGFHVDTETFDRTRRLKIRHLLEMVKAEYGLDYVELRLELGMLYAGAGLDPRIFLAAYEKLVSKLGDLIMKRPDKSTAEGFEAFKSLIKISFFDVSLIVDVIVFERERTILAQQEAIRELSTPALPVREGLLILPMIGVIDSHRSRQMADNLLQAIRTHRARVVVVDITGVPSMDADVANRLVQTAIAARLIGARLVLSGISAQVSQALLALGVDVSSLDTFGDLRGAIEEAEKALGYDVHTPEMRTRVSPPPNHRQANPAGSSAR